MAETKILLSDPEFRLMVNMAVGDAVGLVD